MTEVTLPRPIECYGIRIELSECAKLVWVQAGPDGGRWISVAAFVDLAGEIAQFAESLVPVEA
jgi:hypothetical protein